jgi:hypothetical protein
MKAGRKKRASGGVNAAAEDLSKKNMRYTYQSNVNDEAEERKRGGMVDGKKAKIHAGRKPRKSGGRTGSNMNPLSSAASGEAPKGRTFQSC